MSGIEGWIPAFRATRDAAPIGVTVIAVVDTKADPVPD